MLLLVPPEVALFRGPGDADLDDELIDPWFQEKNIRNFVGIFVQASPTSGIMGTEMHLFTG